MYALGLHFEDDHLKVALVRRHGKEIVIELLRSFFIDANLRPLELLHPILVGKNVRTITALSSQETVFREITLHIRTKRGALSVLPFQAEAVLPFPKEEAFLFPFLEKVGKTTFQARLFAARKKKIEEHLQEWTPLGVDPSFVSGVPQALARWAQFVKKGHIGSCKVLYTSSRERCFALIENGKLLSCQILPPGSLNECERADHFLEQKFPHSSHAPWIKVGSSKNEESAPTLAPFGSYSAKHLQEYAIPLGLSLEALSNDRKSVQWRSGPLVPKHLVRARKKMRWLLTAGSLILAILLGPIGHVALSKQEKALLFGLQELAEILEEVPTTVENEDFSNCLYDLEKEIQQLNRAKKFGTFSPKVSSALAWLGSAPFSPEDLSLQKFRYSIPSTGAIQVELQLELQAETQEIAKQFHSFLKDINGPVDLNREILWVEDPPFYQAQLFLKPI